MIGDTLAHKYRIVSLLGRGGMGAVYEALHADTQERVAVKVLHGDGLEPGAEPPRRFRREVDAARAIPSDHVVRVLEAGQDEATGRLYIVTERLAGEDLQRLLDRVGPLSVDGALRVAAQALHGLADAHAARVIHRDVKPANIFLARRADGGLKVKLLDFGIAKVRPDPLASTAATELTTTGSFLGSPLYMSPEQVQNSRDVDHRTDVWSMGSVLYAMLAGRAPHQHAISVGQLLVAICTSAPPPLADVAPWVPREVAEIVHRALSIPPDERYQTAAAMLEAVSRIVPSGTLLEEMLISTGDRPRPVRASSIPPSPARPSPRIVIAPGSYPPIRGDETTEGREVARSGVPVLGAKSSRLITVDPRRLLGEHSELWTYSLEVHQHLGSLLSRIWKSLRRAGAKVAPMSYGKEWVLYEPRTGRPIDAEGAGKVTLEEAGIKPGTVLWITAPDAPTQVS